MTQSWINSIIKDLDPAILDNLDIVQEYQRNIIDVNWTVAGLKEETESLNHDMLTIVAEDGNGCVYDIMITEPFYPRGINSLEQLAGAEIVGVNPMVEFTRRDGQPALLCKYARLIVNGSRKINPHVGIKNHVHARLCENGNGSAGDVKDNVARSHFSVSESQDAANNVTQLRKKTEIERGDEVSPHEDVILRWS